MFSWTEASVNPPYQPSTRPVSQRRVKVRVDVKKDQKIIPNKIVPITDVPVKSNVDQPRPNKQNTAPV